MRPLAPTWDTKMGAFDPIVINVAVVAALGAGLFFIVRGAILSAGKRKQNR